MMKKLRQVRGALALSTLSTLPGVIALAVVFFGGFWGPNNSNFGNGCSITGPSGQAMQFKCPNGVAFTFTQGASTNADLSTGGFWEAPIGVAVGGGTATLKILKGTGTFSPAAIAAQTCDTASVTVTVAGAVAGDACFPIEPTGAWPLAWACTCTAANTCVLEACNVTTTSKTPVAGGTYGAFLFR